MPFFMKNGKSAPRPRLSIKPATERRAGKYRSRRKSSSLTQPPGRIVFRKNRTLHGQKKIRPFPREVFIGGILCRVQGKLRLFSATRSLSLLSCRLRGGEDLPPSSTCPNAWSTFPVRRHSSEVSHALLQTRLQSFRGTKKTSLSANSGRQADPTEEKKRRVWFDSGRIRNPWLLTTPYLQKLRKKSRFKFFLF